MRAVTITVYSGKGTIRVTEVETPRAVGNRVRVRVKAAGLNRADLMQRRGHYPAPPGAPRDIPGLEFAGEVDQVGEYVQMWRPGQRVYGITGGGAQAEYVIVPEGLLAEIPASLSMEEAASIPEAFITAHDALFTRAHFSPGEKLLVHAAASGVGVAAVQLARAAGADVIIGTARTPGKLERLGQFGLSKGVVVAPEGPTSAAPAILRSTGDSGMDVVLDLAGSAYLSLNMEVLAPLGRLVLIGTMSGSKATLDFSTVMRKRLTIVGTTLRARSEEEKARAVRLFAKCVNPLLTEGKVRPVIDMAYSLEEIEQGYERLESNATFGKVVITL